MEPPGSCQTTHNNNLFTLNFTTNISTTLQLLEQEHLKEPSVMSQRGTEASLMLLHLAPRCLHHLRTEGSSKASVTFNSKQRANLLLEEEEMEGKEEEVKGRKRRRRRLQGHH